MEQEFIIEELTTPKTLISLQEYAAIMGVSIRSCYAQIARKTFPVDYIKPGGKAIKIRTRDLRAYLTSSD